jgi:uncharacterized membrane protein
MISTRSWGLILIAMLVIANGVGLTLHWYYWERLPEQVATHFDAKGQPGNFAPKWQATALLAGVEVGLSWFMVLIGMAMSYIPNGIINIPNRNYWLAGMRRSETLSFMRAVLNGIGLMTALFLMVISYSIFIANRDGKPLDSVIFWSSFVGYMGSMMAVVIMLQLRFRLPK